MKTWIDRLRTDLWLVQVRGATPGWSNYQRDSEFVWRDPSQVNTTHRPKCFERLEKSGTLPNGSDDWLSMDELTERLDDFPGLEGIKDIYMSPIWQLMGMQTHRPREVQQMLNQLLDKYGLVRAPASDALNKDGGAHRYNSIALSKACFNGFVRWNVPRIDRIVIFFLLFLLNEPSHSVMSRQFAESGFEREVEVFLLAFFSEKGLDYCRNQMENMCGALLRARLDLAQTITYPSYVEQEGPWLIVNPDWIGRVDEEFVQLNLFLMK